MLLAVGQDRRADAVHDAFRRAGRAGGVEDIERIVESDAGELDLARFVRRHVFVEQHGARDGGNVRRRLDIGHDQHPLQRRHAGDDAGQLVEAGLDLAVVMVGVGGDQDPGRNLAEPVEHALHAEIRRSRGEDAADAGRRQHGDHRFRHVRHVGRDPVARSQALGAERPGEARNRVVEFAPAHLPAHLVFAAEHDGGRVVAAAQQVLGEIGAAVREEAGAGHLLAVDDDPAAGFADHVAEVPDRRPEFLRFVDRPGVQAGVVREIGAPAVGRRLHEGRHVRRVDAFPARLPHHPAGHGSPPVFFSPAPDR